MSEREVFGIIESSGDHGATMPEIAQLLRLPNDKVKYHVGKMLASGKIITRQRRRMKPNGRSTTVYIAAPPF